MNDNDPSQLAEYEMPEWLAAEQEAQRTREANDRAKIGVATLLAVLCGLLILSTIYASAGGA